MRRSVLTVAMILVSYLSLPTEARATNAKCEGYCGTVAAACYVAVGWLVGREKCDAMYEGCLDGCVAASETEA